MKAIMDAFEAMPYLTVREANNIQQYQDDDDWDFWDLKSIVMDESLEDDSWNGLRRCDYENQQVQCITN